MSTASLRIELFPNSITKAIDFYTRVMNFKLLRHDPHPDSNPEHGYAYLSRDTIRIGLATKPASEYPPAAQDPQSRAQFRIWPTGVEIVIEVDDLQDERDRIVHIARWPLDDDLKRQDWGLLDFRVKDPDGYYLRITERGTRDGRGNLVGSGHPKAE